MRERYGVKIYFDPVSTAAREEDAKVLARRVCADQTRADDINTVRPPAILVVLQSFSGCKSSQLVLVAHP